MRTPEDLLALEDSDLEDEVYILCFHFIRVAFVPGYSISLLQVLKLLPLMSRKKLRAFVVSSKEDKRRYISSTARLSTGLPPSSPSSPEVSHGIIRAALSAILRSLGCFMQSTLLAQLRPCTSVTVDELRGQLESGEVCEKALLASSPRCACCIAANVLTSILLAFLRRKS